MHTKICQDKPDPEDFTPEEKAAEEKSDRSRDCREQRLAKSMLKEVIHRGLD
jgi:hypothetical protein